MKYTYTYIIKEFNYVLSELQKCLIIKCLIYKWHALSKWKVQPSASY